MTLETVVSSPQFPAQHEQVQGPQADDEAGTAAVRLSMRSSTPPWPGKELAAVLEADVALEHALRQIAEHGDQRRGHAEHHEAPDRQLEPSVPRSPAAGPAVSEAARDALPRLAGAHGGRELGAPERRPNA